MNALSQNYRPDIDGLRAIAVLSVVGYHFEVPGFSGGFIGVDVFFVISGYLITGVVLKDIHGGQFSLWRFYERRARRIIPAYAAMLIVSTGAAYWLLFPTDLRDYSQTLVATSVFASNILFYIKAGYFAAPSELKPLLHTWSLSVEEQFYIVYPLLLLLLCRTRWALAGLCVLSLMSFAASQWFLPDNKNGVFFLAHFRAWELGLGCMAALLINARFRNGFLTEAVSVFGLAAILVSVFWLSSDKPFPGLSALPACAGTAALILANRDRLTLSGKLLATGPFVGIGLISYSLYLWHWPLLVFWKYRTGATPGNEGIVALFAASVLLAFLSWQYIEKPVRNRKFATSSRHVFAGSGVLIAGMTAIGLAGHVQRGFPERWSEQVARYDLARLDYNPDRNRCAQATASMVRYKQICKLGPNDGARARGLLVWGDSHANAMQPAFKKLAKNYAVPGWFAARVGCSPLLKPVGPSACRSFNREVLEFIKRENVSDVVLVSRWSQEFRGNGDGRVRKLLAAITSAGARPWLFHEVPEAGFMVPIALARQAATGDPAKEITIERSSDPERFRAFRQLLERFESTEEVRIIDPLLRLCEKDQCKISANGRALYYDGNHLSATGALWLSPVLGALFVDLRKDASQSGRAVE